MLNSPLKHAVVVLLVSAALAGCGDPGKDSKENPDPVVVTPTPPVNSDSATCADYIPGTKASSDYLCAHNDVRAEVTPVPAAPLPALTWNPDLAQVAKAWAETCTWDHNPDRSSQYGALRGVQAYVGENLYLSSAPVVTPYEAVEAWAGEAAFYHYDTNSCDGGQMCGHYTQLVWSETREVGCARALCATVAGSTLTDATLIVCNYTPGGNIVGQKPY